LLTDHLQIDWDGVCGHLNSKSTHSCRERYRIARKKTWDSATKTINPPTPGSVNKNAQGKVDNKTPRKAKPKASKTAATDDAEEEKDDDEETTPTKKVASKKRASKVMTIKDENKVNEESVPPIKGEDGQGDVGDRLLGGIWAAKTAKDSDRDT
jgi:hypothetical protein